MIENEPQPIPDRAWRQALALLLVVVGLVLAINLSGIRPSKPGSTRASAEIATAIESGDRSAKVSLALSGKQARSSASDAIDQYSRAVPWPAAERRIGIAREIFLHKPGLPYLSKVASSKQARSLPRSQFRKLQSEARMWRDVYDSNGVAPGDVARYVARVRKLNLGPLKEAAVSQVYARAGQVSKANTALADAKSRAKASALGLVVFGVVALVALLAGIVIANLFLRQNQSLNELPPHPLHSSLLFVGFTTYLIFYLLFASVLGLATSAVAIGAAASVGLEIAATVAAFALALVATTRVAAGSGQDIRLIGLRLIPLGRAVKWAVGGYCAAIPFMLIALVIATTIFRGVETPQHPIVQDILAGGAAFWASFALAVIVAPIVEETFFRGMLYGGLRGKMHVWPAAAISGALFAAVHPTLPVGFLPILVLGTVLAILREKTGSLLPCMICHGLNNAAMLVFARLLY